MVAKLELGSLNVMGADHREEASRSGDAGSGERLEFFGVNPVGKLVDEGGSAGRKLRAGAEAAPRRRSAASCFRRRLRSTY